MQLSFFKPRLSLKCTDAGRLEGLPTCPVIAVFGKEYVTVFILYEVMGTFTCTPSIHALIAYRSIV